jgi:GT2 family glycosyltransferase
MKITILIPIYNRIAITKLGLASLYDAVKYYTENSKNQYSICTIVIDDGSTDGSSLWIEKNYPDIIILKGNGNLWWTGAINLGARYAIDNFSTDYVILWNDDTFCEISYFVELENLLSRLDNDIIIGSTILNSENNQLWSKLLFFNQLTGTSSYKKKMFPFGLKSLNWLTGMGTIIPSFIIKEIGYWNNEKFPQYFGDIDFTLRASKKNYKIIGSEKLIIYNKTEYSSYTASDIKSFLKSLNSNNLSSRYNLKIRSQFYKEHCISFFWIITLFLYYIKYAIKTSTIYIKNLN